MSKRAVLLHGTDGNPNNHWFPWLANLLNTSGYEVFSPGLPNNHTPNSGVYDTFLQESGWDFADNVIIGHSSGATTVLNLLSAGWFPRVQAAILVSTFLNQKLTKDADWTEQGQFDNLFHKTYDPEVLKQRANSFYFFHGDNDPYCDIEDAKLLCEQLGGDFTTIENGHHLGSASGMTELPEIATALRKDNLLP